MGKNKKKKQEKCTTCNGTGRNYKAEHRNIGTEDAGKKILCRDCNGSGKK